MCQTDEKLSIFMRYSVGDKLVDLYCSVIYGLGLGSLFFRSFVFFELQIFIK